MDLASLGISALQNRMDQQKASLESAIAQVSNGGSGDQQKDMIMLQFQLGQYNAMVETVSNITKSMTDMLKSLAQKVS
ncbi:MAG TPA: type III secretion protein [Succinivibrionaceae bacterium]|nr:type III secretion protein [Succinivibrionaceae bacterium]